MDILGEAKFKKVPMITLAYLLQVKLENVGDYPFIPMGAVF